ncbi:MAG: UDP-N-acetylmuramate--L-alanine ligase [Planctomycetota bacterium]|jgi:UDP-N-acetylmuramate--alanine ligase
MIAHDIVDLSAPRRLHLLGIGGSGMAPFARLLVADGHCVSGADAHENERVARLRGEGVRVLTGANADSLPLALDAIIHTAAIPSGAAPLERARQLQLPVLKYARAVGLFAERRRTWAVAGTHGKTTTSAMLAYVLHEAGLDPAILVGGAVPQLDARKASASGPFVLEACEYDRSFLHLKPEVAIVTNVEPEHLDYYRDIVEIRNAFRAFAAQVSDLLVVHESLREVIGRAGGVRARVRTFGPSPDADLRVLPLGRRGFVVEGREFPLQLPGFHNVLNAAAVLQTTRQLGIATDAVREALTRFHGVGRRLEVIGRPRGVPVIDDYAHHPTEVAAGLKALRDAYAPRRLWVVFQPHQFSRLRRFLEDFARALTAADRIVIPEVYAARDREDDRRAVSPGDLVDAVRSCGGDAIHIPEFSTIVDFVRTQARAGDVVVTMGAGDVGDVAGRLAEAL